MNYFAQLTAPNAVANPVDFAPVNNALTAVTQQNNANRSFGLQQQQSARADEQLALQKQETAAALKNQALDYEQKTHQLAASIAQGTLAVQDPAARSQVWQGYLKGHPDMADSLTKAGVDPQNADAGLQFFANYGQNPLDVQAKKAQISQTQSETELARAPKLQAIGQDVFGTQYGKVNPLTGDVISRVDAGQGAGEDVVKNLADGIQSGKQLPVLTGGQGTGAKINAAVKSELQKRGFDLTKANLEWEAAHKQILSLNGPQMVRYAGLSNSVLNTIDEVNGLSKQMANSGVTGLNAAKIATLINTAGNTQQGQMAAKYNAAVNTLKEEFANLAQGGYAPTEAAWGLANQQINGNYGVDELGASLGEVQRLLRYRLNGIPNMQTLGPGTANRYVGGGQPSQGGEAPAGSPPAATAQPAPAGAGPSGAPAAPAPVRVNTPEDALKLPPGTPFMTPDGRLKVRP